MLFGNQLEPFKEIIVAKDMNRDIHVVMGKQHKLLTALARIRGGY